MKKHKTLGIFLVLSLPITLVLFAITSVVFNSAAQYSTIDMPQATSTTVSLLGERTLAETVASVVKLVLGFLGILSLIVLTPLGIYFLVKKEDSLEQIDPAMAHKYQNLTPEQLKYIRGGSLSAFFGGLIWPLGSKLWLYALLSLVPLVNIYVWLKLTFHGRRMSWEKGEWQSFDQFKQRQKLLVYIILAVFVLYILFLFLSQ